MSRPSAGNVSFSSILLGVDVRVTEYAARSRSD
jgi:hypothetical protein